jgi:hypothetical protein
MLRSTAIKSLLAAVPQEFKAILQYIVFVEQFMSQGSTQKSFRNNTFMHEYVS